MSGASQTSQDSSPVSQNSASVPSRQFLFFPIVVAATWIAVLGWLTFHYSNPVTLNLAQIHASDLVVIGRLDASRPGVLLKGQQENGEWPLQEEELEVSALPRNLPTGEYIVPLARNSRWQPADHHLYRVTPTPLPGNVSLVYPANDDGLSQLKEISEQSLIPDQLMNQPR